jgi:hypothetical protein
VYDLDLVALLASGGDGDELLGNTPVLDGGHVEADAAVLDFCRARWAN